MPKNHVTSKPHPRSSDPYYESTGQAITEKKVIIQPGGGKAVGLGVYNAALESPEVALSYRPDLGGDIGVSHERLDIPGREQYMLLYQFQNFSQQPCQITLHLNARHMTHHA